MSILLKTLFIIVVMLISYLIGAIPNGIIIGKIVRHIDIRNYGSHNSGGTNAGRVLGKKFGVLTIILDAVKIVLPFWIIRLILPLMISDSYLCMNLCYLTLLAACFGHCFPIYCHFKGGKAVSTYFGCILATNYIICGLFIICFALVLIIKRYVSLASIAATVTVTIIATIAMAFEIPQLGFWPSLEPTFLYVVILWLNGFLLFIRHYENLIRLINGTERKITWLK